MNALRSARAYFVLALLVTAGMFSTAEVARAATPRDLHIITPCRIYDSRLPGASPSGPLVEYVSHAVNLPTPDRCGVPTDAVSLIINATIVNPPSDGYLVVFQGGTALPAVPPGALAFQQSDILGQFRVVQLGTSPAPELSVEARMGASDGQTFHVVIDVLAYNGSGAPSDIALSNNTVLENEPVDTLVGTLSTTDPDFDDTHTYTLVAGTGDTDNLKFKISGNQVLTDAVLDRETQQTYSIRVRSTDNFAVFSEEVFTIEATNENEAPTDITLSSNQVAEGLPTGTLVGTFSTTDVDLGDTHSYAFVTDPLGPDNGSFQISGNQLLTNEVFDLETKSSYTIYVSTTDSGALSFNKQFTITVDNANDAPAPTGGPFSLAENSPAATVVGTVAPNDPDGGTHTFSITAGNTGGAFAINATTGQITVATPAALDFETTPTFSLTVQVTDDGTPAQTGSGTVVINLTNVNEAPVPSGGPFSIPENSANATAVGTVTVADQDTGQSHTFAITAGNTGNAFAINPATGAITVATASALDFETTPTFNLTVEVTDNGTPALTGSLVVVVNLTNANDAPVPSGGPFSIPENSANGTSVGTVTVADQDTGQSHTFAITAGNTGSAFAINPATGTITVATSAALNFETTPTFNLTVEVTDNGTPAQTGSTTVVVNLTNVNEAPVPSGGPFSIAENSANSTAVGTVLAGDQDAAQSHTFSITAGNTGGAFTINSSGVISVANSAALNFEATPTFNLTVQVTDNGTPNLSGSTAVVVNLTNVNEAPVPSGGPFSIPENSANATSVGTVTAVDEDAAQSYTFSITAGNTGGAFAINSTTGEITVANSAALNFEVTPTFNLTVQVTDNGTPALSGSTTVVVNLTNVNEAPLPAGGPFSIAENSANGTTVGTVATNDPDTGQSHTFSITAGNTGGAFAISNAGVITVANVAAVNFEVNPNFNLTVEVTDNGTPTQTGSTTVVINLTNVNEAPVPSGGPFTIPENSANGTTVGTVLASDPDVGQTHTFSITAGNTNGAFAINATTGQITVANVTAVNYEATPVFNLTVQVTDNGTPALSGTTTVTINLQDVPEAPVANDEGTPASPYVETVGNTFLEVVPSPTPGGETKISFNGNILINDFDQDVPTTLTVALESATAGASVTLHPTNGTFTYVPPAGFTGVDSFTYRLTDQTGLFDTATVYINVEHRVWYVKNNHSAGGLGRSIDPFDTLAEAESASSAGDTIYVFEGNATTLGQSDGIALKNGQRLIGEEIQLAVPSAVNINGVNGPTLRTVTGNRPKIENDNTPDAAGEDNGVSVPATAGSMTGVEIRGLEISGFDNAIDVTATGANNASVTIDRVTVSGASLEGIDVNAGSTGTVTLGVQNVTVTSTGTGIDIQRTAGTVGYITAFNNLSVTGNTGGMGINIAGFTFDGTPGGSFNTLSVSPMTIGTSSANGVGQSGLVMANVQGDLTFGSLNIFADGGAGLRASSSTAYTGSAGLRLTATGATAIIEATNGPVVDIAQANLNFDLGAIKSTNSPTTGLALNSVTGSFAAASGSSISNITSAAGTAFQVGSSSATVTFPGTISTNQGKGVDLTSNSGTITFSGALSLSTGTNTAFNATGGGTVAATNTSSTLTTGTATALNVNGTTIGAGGLKFRSISSNGGGNSGIVLNNTGSSGGLAVGGNGGTCTSAASCTGGAIQNKTVDGISLNNTRSVSLTRMFIDNNDGSGIFGDDVTDFTLISSRVTNNADTATGAEAGIRFNELLGNCAITDSTITGSSEDNIRITPASGVLSQLTISGGSIGFNSAATGGHGVSLIGTGTAQATMDITGVTFESNRSSGVIANITDTGNFNVSVANSVFRDNGAAVTLQTSSSADLTFDVLNNTEIVRSISNAIQLVAGSNSTPASEIRGTISGNVVGNGTSDSGSRDLYGIALDLRGDQDSIIAVNNNNVRNSDFEGIWVSSADFGTLAGPSAKLDLTLRDNTVGAADDNSGFPVGLIRGVLVDGRHTTTVCLDMFSNTSTGIGGGEHFRLRQRDTAAFHLERLSDGDGTPNELINAAATIEAHISAQNDPGSTADATLITGFIEAANGFCRKP